MKGMLADLGISSDHVELSGRGFSFMKDEPLDMRFDPGKRSRTAADVLNSYSRLDLEKVISEFGEERRARQLSKAIVERRRRVPFKSTRDLVDTVYSVKGGKSGRIHPATKVFQALRIEVNRELEGFEEFLMGALKLLMPGGRLALITFHSIEDRLMKRAFRKAGSVSFEKALEKGFLILTKKPLRPSEGEVRGNPRSRSAKLRAIERMGF